MALQIYEHFKSPWWRWEYIIKQLLHKDQLEKGQNGKQNLLKTSNKEILWHITWSSCSESEVRTSTLFSKRVQLEPQGALPDFFGYYKGGKGQETLSIRGGSENHKPQPYSQDHSSESWQISGDLGILGVLG